MANKKSVFSVRSRDVRINSSSLERWVVDANTIVLKRFRFMILDYVDFPRELVGLFQVVATCQGKTNIYYNRLYSSINRHIFRILQGNKFAKNLYKKFR